MGCQLSLLHLHTLELPFLSQFEDFEAPVINYSVKTSGIPIADVRKTYKQAIAGGDYNASPHTVQTVTGAGAVSFSVPDLVQPWVDGTTPYGQLEIVGFTGTGNAFTMAHDPVPVPMSRTCLAPLDMGQSANSPSMVRT